MRYSIFALALNAFTGHRKWPAAWRDASPKDHYDVLVIGGGGHGLATAYYLAKNHEIRNVAVLEKGWIGSATPAETRQLSARTICFPATSHSMNGR